MSPCFVAALLSASGVYWRGGRKEKKRGGRGMQDVVDAVGVLSDRVPLVPGALCLWWQNKWRGTHHNIIFGFFVLASSQVLILKVSECTAFIISY